MSRLVRGSVGGGRGRRVKDEWISKEHTLCVLALGVMSEIIGSAGMSESKATCCQLAGLAEHIKRCFLVIPS